MDNSSPKPGTSTRKPTPAEARRSAKNERKRAGQEAARLAAVARRRRNAGLGVFFGVIAIVGVIVLITTLGGTPPKKTTASQPTASTSASAAPVPTSGPQAPESAAPSTFTPNIPAGESSKFKTKPVVKAGTGSLTGLKTKILIEGTGTAIKSGDSIRADYVGVSYADGTEFDSSWKDGQDFTTVIGKGQVIKGWDQALIGVKAGTRIQVDVPEALAYQGQAGYPSGALRFVIDVLVVTPAA